ncbi:MAG: hypothetical protein BWK74_01000 [Desulfobacteraceae bacterium A6]|nr:MAG: hypothetical protein BWK74_01000 [Desulfobacteraceae bacterium A6]
MTSLCNDGTSDQICPISKAQCSGDCMFADILENVDIGIIVIDYVKQTLIFQNSTAKSYIQYDQDSSNFHYLCSLLLPEFMSGKIPEQHQHLHQNYIHYHDRVLGYTVYNVVKDCVWIFLKDVTEKSRLEAIAEAINTTTNIGYVLSGIQHEIGNPINSIKMVMSVLKHNLERYSPETIHVYIDRTLAEIQKIEYLLKSMKNFNMLEKPDLQDVDIRIFLDKLVTLAREDFESKGIRILVDDIWGDVTACLDPRMFQQVILNILTNAADALDENVTEPAIRISVSTGSGLIWLRIVDNGSGISEERQKELFKPFYTSKVNGTGLGLVISKKMLAKMSCTIDIKSADNNGTAVTISIPPSKHHA